MILRESRVGSRDPALEVSPSDPLPETIRSATARVCRIDLSDQCAPTISRIRSSSDAYRLKRPWDVAADVAYA